jgi:hypothetical protein
LTGELSAIFAAEFDGLSEKRLRELRILERNEITFFRGEIANGGPDTTGQIAHHQRRLEAIETRLAAIAPPAPKLEPSAHQREVTLTDEFDGLSEKRLRELHILAKNDITFKRGQMANGGPDTTEQIAYQKKRVEAIETRLAVLAPPVSKPEPALVAVKAQERHHHNPQSYGYRFSPGR